MAKTYHSSNRWALAGLFKRINLGDDPKQLRNEASHLAEKVSPEDIAAAQQALIDEGYSCQLVQKISAAFMLMGLCKKKKASAESKLPENHILERIFAEHALDRCYLADLEQVSKQISALDHFTNVSSEFRRLAQIVEYFIEVKKQLDREDDLIFPYLTKLGWKGLSQSSRDEHDLIKAEIDNLINLVTGFNIIGHENFTAWLPLVSKRLCSLMLDHLSFEQEILWPIALVVIDDANAWETIKALSDEFGY